MPSHGSRSAGGDRTNAAIGWIVLTTVAVAAAVGLRSGRVLWGATVVAIVGIALILPVATRSATAMVPWTVLVAIAVPILVYPVGAGGPLGVLLRLAVAVGVALAITMELHALTSVRMNRPFAVVTVVMVTITITGARLTALWITDLLLGTTFVDTNGQVMWEFVGTVGVGGVGAVGARRYLAAYPGAADDRAASTDATIPEDGRRPEDDVARYATATLRHRLGLSPLWQRRLTRTLQLLLGGMFLVGIGRLAPDLIANAGLALVITFLPGLLRREFGLPMDVGLTLWITAVVFLHGIGSLLFYGDVLWWHNLTHALSATLVGGVGYAVYRAIDEHTRAVSIPPGSMFAFVVLFVVSFGVLWEIAEFALDGVTAHLGREADAAAQHGLTDTMTDLIANGIGGMVVAGWGTVYLTDVAQVLGERVDAATDRDD